MLRVEGLRAGYGPLDVLRDVSFEAPTGAAVAILGANGAGKTTLMRALTGLIRTRGGSVTLEGVSIERMPAERRVRHGLALVPEGRELFSSLTVRENLAIGAFTRPNNHAAIAEDVERVLRYFPRLRERLDAQAASLSGGEGQMLAIGRALMARPRVLLLDEPSLGLAPSVVDTVFDVIQQLNREQVLTVLLVEQNARKAMSVVQSAYVLQGGIIALHGTTTELSRTSSVRQLYLGGDAVSSASPAQPIAEAGGAESMSTTLLPGISERTVETPRLRTYLLSKGAESGTPVVFVHGNVSSSRFYEETLAALPETYWGIAPDLRGYGDSEPKAVDATRGLRDFSDDLRALFEALNLTGARRPHLVGWSMGGGVIQQYAIDHPADVTSLTLIDPVSPFGFGGTKDAQGTPCYADFAGSGGGTANPDYVKRLVEKDRSEESPNSPRNVMNAFYFKPPFRAAPEREEVFMDSMLKMTVSDGDYPGDTQTSENWPNVRPGTQGINNALAPQYLNVSAFADISPKPAVLWVRGGDDQIVSDTSFLDFGTLGSLGYVPGWPGSDVFPSQPMVSQIRHVLDRYRGNGGSYTEIVVPDSGHAPLIEKPEEFRQRLFAFLAGQG